MAEKDTPGTLLYQATVASIAHLEKNTFTPETGIDTRANLEANFHTKSKLDFLYTFYSN